MQLRSQGNSDSKLHRLEQAIYRARLALGWERLWPRLVPLLSVVGLFVVLSWLGYWRIGGDPAPPRHARAARRRAALEPDEARPLPRSRPP